MSGVSVSTVSNFLNHPDKVSPATAEVIRAAIEKHQWRPDIRRRGPKNAERVGVRTGNILLLTMTNYSPQEMIKMPTTSMLFYSIQYELNLRQFSMILSGVGENGELPGVMSSQSCDGVILMGKPSKQTEAGLNRRLEKLPSVWCFRECPQVAHQMDHVLYDNRVIGGMATDYLHSHGHRQVAVINAGRFHEAYIERKECFIRQAERYGMKVCVVDHAPSAKYATAADFSEMTDEFLRQSNKEVSGAFFCSDDAMLGFYNELRFRQGSEPQLDMIGCNANEDLLRYFSRRPASIDIRLEEVGKMTVELLLRRINGNSSCFSEIFIKPELIPGE